MNWKVGDFLRQKDDKKVVIMITDAGNKWPPKMARHNKLLQIPTIKKTSFIYARRPPIGFGLSSGEIEINYENQEGFMPFHYLRTSFEEASQHEFVKAIWV
jgi:hypothetical protein